MATATVLATIVGVVVATANVRVGTLLLVIIGKTLTK